MTMTPMSKSYCSHPEQIDDALRQYEDEDKTNKIHDLKTLKHRRLDDDDDEEEEEEEEKEKDDDDNEVVHEKTKKQQSEVILSPFLTLSRSRHSTGGNSSRLRRTSLPDLDSVTLKVVEEEHDQHPHQDGTNNKKRMKSQHHKSISQTSIFDDDYEDSSDDDEEEPTILKRLVVVKDDHASKQGGSSISSYKNRYHQSVPVLKPSTSALRRNGATSSTGLLSTCGTDGDFTKQKKKFYEISELKNATFDTIPSTPSPPREAFDIPPPPPRDDVLMALLSAAGSSSSSIKKKDHKRSPSVGLIKRKEYSTDPTNYLHHVRSPSEGFNHRTEKNMFSSYVTTTSFIKETLITNTSLGNEMLGQKI